MSVHALETSQTYSCVPVHYQGWGWYTGRSGSWHVPRGKSDWCWIGPWCNVQCVLWNGEEKHKKVEDRHKCWKVVDNYFISRMTTDMTVNITTNLYSLHSQISLVSPQSTSDSLFIYILTCHFNKTLKIMIKKSIDTICVNYPLVVITIALQAL